MLRIYLPYVANLLESLGELKRISSDTSLSENRYKFYSAKTALDAFLNRSVWADSLRVCKSPGKSLMGHIDVTLEKENDTNLDDFDIYLIGDAVDSFKTVLEAEFQTSSVYLVTARRGYDIPSLLEHAEILFPDELMTKIPAVRFDLREAGKCIAFDIGTAAGFHLLRALETVICCYWNVVMGGKSLPENRNLGAYIREMENAKVGDGKVLTALRQIKDFHRNSLMHPEETLDLDQAIALLGIVQSAIIAMLPAIPDEDGLKLMTSARGMEVPVDG